MENRIKRLREKFREINIDGVLVTDPKNIFYFSGYDGDSGSLLIGKDKKVIITNSLSAEYAQEKCQGFEIRSFAREEGVHQTIFRVLVEFNIKQLGFEENNLTFKQYQNCVDNYKDVNLIPLKDCFYELRQIKDEREIEIIKKAARIGDEAFSHIISIIKPGITENEIALELEIFMRKKGAKGLSFDTIVVSGSRTSMIHSMPSDKKVEFGDVLMMDFGCVYEGYCSDMTRTVFVGKANEEIKDIYKIVLKAQNAGIEALKAGMRCKDIDEIARNIIANNGYSENFGHGLGHSLGLEVHETPNLSPKYEGTLQPNMVVTVEPGIYIPGKGGVRIEDLLLVTENGCENLVSSSKEIIVL